MKIFYCGYKIVNKLTQNLKKKSKEKFISENMFRKNSSGVKFIKNRF